MTRPKAFLACLDLRRSLWLQVGPMGDLIGRLTVTSFSETAFPVEPGGRCGRAVMS